MEKKFNPPIEFLKLRVKRVKRDLDELEQLVSIAAEIRSNGITVNTDPKIRDLYGFIDEDVSNIIPELKTHAEMLVSEIDSLLCFKDESQED